MSSDKSDDPSFLPWAAVPVDVQDAILADRGLSRPLLLDEQWTHTELAVRLLASWTHHDSGMADEAMMAAAVETVAQMHAMVKARGGK